MTYPENDWREYLSHHGIAGQKWGQRNGPPYPLKPEARSRAEQDAKMYRDSAKRSKNKADWEDIKIGADLASTCDKIGNSIKMTGLENRLKSVESTERKLRKLERPWGDVGKEQQIKDALRYTLNSDDNEYVDNYFKVKSELSKKGYTETRCKNYFIDYRNGKVKHKSVQSNFKSPDGYEFEIQFHTPSSEDARSKKVPIYNKARTLKESDKRLPNLEKQMVELAEKVNDPVGIERIKSH